MTTRRKAVTVEPAPRRRRSGLMIGFVAGVLVVVGGGVTAVVLTGRTGSQAPIVDQHVQPPQHATPAEAAVASEEDKESRRALKAAADFERSQPERPDLAIAKYREVRVRYPLTTAASEAEQRTRALEEKLKGLFERELEGIRSQARALAGKGDFRGALDALAAYVRSDAKEILKKRADVEAAAIGNEARDRFNQAVLAAEHLAKKGHFDDAITQFAKLQPLFPDDLHNAIRMEMDSLTDAKSEFADIRAQIKEDAIEEKVLAAAPAILDACRRRRFEEAIKSLDALPACDATRDERDLLTCAATFWESFLKALRGRAGQEVSLLLADGKRATGKLARVADDRATVGVVEIAFDKLHDDQLVLLAIGSSGLPPAAHATYVQAAMFFLCQGNRELSRLYMSTAYELGANAASAPVERAWRGGLLQAALAPKK